MNIAQLLLQQMQQRPQALAIRHAGGTLTYGQFGERVLRASAGLRAAGIAIGDVVAIQLDDPFDHWLATLAVAHRGATVLSIARSMPDEQAARLLSLTRCTRVLAKRAVETTNISKLLPTLPWSEVKEHPVMSSDAPAVSVADRPWIFVSGSGSTGRPKIMPVHHRQQWQRAMLGPRWLPYGHEDVLLSLVSMHFYAAKQRCLEALVQGAGVFLDAPGRVDHRAKVARGEVTAIYGTVSHVERLMGLLPAQQSPHYERLRALMVGGSVVSMRLREQIRQRLTPKLYVLWGTNESHTATITRLSEVFKTEGGVGRPFPGVRVEVVDDADVPLAPGVRGRIRVASPSTIEGYLEEPDATHKAFRKGWFYPGDIGHITPDGQLVHEGRTDDMMIVSGVNVYPAEIEEQLRGVPGVADALALPLRHSQLQDLPVALVVPEPGVTLDGQALVQHVRSQIGRHTLHDLVFVERIPRNEQGKVQREAVSQIVRLKWGSDTKPAALPAKPADEANGRPSGTVVVGFKPPQGVDPSALSAWLAVLDEGLAPAHELHRTRDADYGSRHWLEQVLTLARGLLHVLRVPVFDPIGILECYPSKDRDGRWEAVCRLPDSSLVSGSVMEGVLKVAFKLAAGICKADVDSPIDRENFFKAIEKEVLRSFAKVRPNGKSTFDVLRVAHSLGIPYRSLAGGVFQLGWGSQARRIDRSTTDRDSAMGLHWTQNKLFTAQLLRQADLPAPVHARVESLLQARQAAERIGYPVVIKPADLERGEGVSVDVRAESLEAAFNNAHKLSPAKIVLVEQQVPGVCHRLFIAAGKLLYAVRRLPIGVYADGRSSISALVEAECKAQQRIPPWKRSGIRPLDELALDMLRRQGWVPDSVPQAGQFVALRRIETTAWGGVDEEVTHTLHPDNVSAAIAAAQIFGLEVAGVDMISRDIKQPWHTNGAIINEVNYAPLLGGGEISRRYIAEHLSRILKDKGRIPVYIFVGGEPAWAQGREQWERMRANGTDAYLTGGQQTLDAKANTLFMASSSVQSRVQALLMRREVQALVVIVQSTHEVDMINRLSGGDLMQAHEPPATEELAGNRWTA